MPFPEGNILTRREEREQAFILLFEKAFNEETEVAELYDFAIENEVIVGSDFVKSLLFKTWENVESIDSAIEKYSVGWKISRISKVALAVLRLAVCEILYFDDIPAGVSINEAVELCKKYAAKDDASFVNGLLGTASKDLK
jgi:N utilization substance protein B